MFSEKSFNFRPILTVVYILSADFTPFTLLYFTKEESKLVTLEREIKPDGKDENYMQIAKFKDRRQNLKAKLKSGSMKIGKKRKRKQHIQTKKSDWTKVKYCIYDLKPHSDWENGMKDKLLQKDRNKNH